MIKLPFSQQEHLQSFPTSLAKRSTCASIRFRVRDPKNIFYYQRDVQNYTDQILDFSLFDKHEFKHGIFWSVILVSIFMLRVYVAFFCCLRFDWQNQFSFSEDSFLGELASYWLLTLYVTSFLPMKIGSLHWNGAAYTCKEQLWWKFAGEY